MPDWQQIVRGKFRALADRSPEFAEELAAHLEDTYEALLCEGLPVEVALQHTLGQIEGRCRRRLVMRFLQEEIMTGFIRQAVLPGLITSAAACFFYWTLALDHIRHKVIWLLGGQLPLWWWCLLPVFGALGAILYRRNRGLRPQRIAVSLLPSAVMGIGVGLIFFAGFTLSGFVNPYQLVAVRVESLGLWPPGFVLVPAVFSLLGAGIAEVNTRKYLHLA